MLFGVALDTWSKWWAAALYTFFLFVFVSIAAFSGDAIWSFLTNVVMDPKAKYIPYTKMTCLTIIQVQTIYGISVSYVCKCTDAETNKTEIFIYLFASVGVCFSVIGTFVALSQVLLNCVLLTTSQLENTKLTQCYGNRLTLLSFESPRTSPSTSSQLGGMCLHVFVFSSTSCVRLHCEIVCNSQTVCDSHSKSQVSERRDRRQRAA
jgi:hypothetical protein